MTHAAVFYVLAGIAGGIMGGMGLGGGTLLIPLLTIFLDAGGKQAAALNLVSFIPMSVAACVVHAKNRLLDVKKALLVAIPACATCTVSSLFAQKISSQLVSDAFAVFLIVLACVMILFRSAALAGDLRSRADIFLSRSNSD